MTNALFIALLLPAAWLAVVALRGRRGSMLDRRFLGDATWRGDVVHVVYRALGRAPAAPVTIRASDVARVRWYRFEIVHAFCADEPVEALRLVVRRRRDVWVCDGWNSEVSCFAEVLDAARARGIRVDGPRSLPDVKRGFGWLAIVWAGIVVAAWTLGRAMLG
jgi:hypothetical protein